MEIPTIHLNGSSRNTLIEQYKAEYKAVDTALEVLRSNRVLHARDYYVQKDQFAFAKAVEQHSNRIKALTSVRDDLYTILEKLIVR